jgi:hypothetical protein
VGFAARGIGDRPAQAQQAAGQAWFQISAIGGDNGDGMMRAMAVDGSTGRVYALYTKPTAAKIEAELAGKNAQKKPNPNFEYTWRLLSDGPK